MTESEGFSRTEMDQLEDKLWALVESHYPLHGSSLPPFESLLRSSDDCATFADDLLLYADALERIQIGDWQQHPFHLHLSACLECQNTLQQVLAAHRERPKPYVRADANVDISIFDRHLPEDDEKTVRDILDPRRPALLVSDFLDIPKGWHYTLEAVPRAEDARPSLLLTLLRSDDAAAGVEVTLVSFGQILRGQTDDRGQIYFSPVVIPRSDDPLAPSLTLRLHVAEQAQRDSLHPGA